MVVVQFPCMILQSATVTSKLQFTIPILIARKVGLKSGEKVQVFEEDGHIVITPAKQLLTELAGSLSLPNRWRGKDMNLIIEESKRKYFKSKNI